MIGSVLSLTVDVCQYVVTTRCLFRRCVFRDCCVDLSLLCACVCVVLESFVNMCVVSSR